VTGADTTGAGLASASDNDSGGDPSYGACRSSTAAGDAEPTGDGAAEAPCAYESSEYHSSGDEGDPSST
jgi:hypothetical protein